MTLLEKINKLNKMCNGNLTMTHYGEWQINSYGDNTPLRMEVKYPFIQHENFEELINMAIEFVEQHNNTITLNGKTYKLVEEVK